MKQAGEKKYYFFFASAMMLMLFGPGWDPGKFLFGLDTFTLHLPYLIYAKRLWAEFQSLPFWMPDIYMGMPSIDAANLMFFYPTNLLSVLLPLPVEQFYLADLIIHMAAAAFGMYIFLRRHDCEKHAAYFGAFVYMFSGPLVTYAYNGHWPDIKAIALVPYVFYFIDRAVREKRVFFYLSAGLFLALQITGIGMQVAAYTLISSAMYAGWLLYSAKADRKQITGTAVFFVLTAVSAAMFSAPQFFPSQEYMKFSWRNEFAYDEFVNFSFNPWESIVFFLPQFFGLKDGMYWGFFQGSAVSFFCGLLPFLLAGFAFLTGKHRKLSVFFLGFTVFIIVMAAGGYTPLYKLLYHVPVFNKFRNPARFLCLLPFAMSFFAAAGFGSLLSQDKDTKAAEKLFNALLKITAAVAAILLLVIAGENFLKGVLSGIFTVTRAKFTNQPMPLDGLSNAVTLVREDVLYFCLVCGLFFAFTYLILKKKMKSALLISLLFCGLQFFDMWRVDKKFISYRTVAEFAPPDEAAKYMKNDKTIFRAADFTFAWEMNRNMYYGLEFFVGYHAILHNKMLNLLGNEVYRYRNILRLFNVKYHLNPSEPPEYAGWGLKKVTDGPIKLFEDPGVLPRVFLTDRIKKFSNDGEILAYMKTPQFDPMEALVKDGIILTEGPEKLVSSAAITLYTPNRIKVDAVTNKQSLLVLSNMYYHRWKVMVDKKPEKIYNIDYCINGVRLDAGTHELDFYYDAWPITACIMIMFGFFVIYAAVYFLEKRRNQLK